MSIGCDEAFTRFASRLDAAIVIDRQSRLVQPGRASINTNSSSQSSAASLACSEPNNSVTEKGGPFRIETLSLEGPRRDEVLVKVVATGLCHTDMVARDKGYPVPHP